MHPSFEIPPAREHIQLSELLLGRVLVRYMETFRLLDGPVALHGDEMLSDEDVIASQAQGQMIHPVIQGVVFVDDIREEERLVADPPAFRKRPEILSENLLFFYQIASFQGDLQAEVVFPGGESLRTQLNVDVQIVLQADNLCHPRDPGGLPAGIGAAVNEVIAHLDRRQIALRGVENALQVKIVHELPEVITCRDALQGRLGHPPLKVCRGIPPDGLVLVTVEDSFLYRIAV